MDETETKPGALVERFAAQAEDGAHYLRHVEGEGEWLATRLEAFARYLREEWAKEPRKPQIPGRYGVNVLALRDGTAWRPELRGVDLEDPGQRADAVRRGLMPEWGARAFEEDLAASRQWNESVDAAAKASPTYKPRR